jgi:hypothetical protein
VIVSGPEGAVLSDSAKPVLALTCLQRHSTQNLCNDVQPFMVKINCTEIFQFHKLSL